MGVSLYESLYYEKIEIDGFEDNEKAFDSFF